MTPMIDIIFLLLIFFILTTSFVPNERVIASLMPTRHGQVVDPKPTEIVPREEVAIRLWPAGMDDHAQPSVLQKSWGEISRRDFAAGGKAVLQIGRGNTIIIDGGEFNTDTLGEKQRAAIEKVHATVIEQLRLREVEGGRQEQEPVVIHCFSGLPWKYALVVYDAVRFYEGMQTGIILGSDIMATAHAREVSFAPPRIRNYHEVAQGQELYEIINHR